MSTNIKSEKPLGSACKQQEEEQHQSHNHHSEHEKSDNGAPCECACGHEHNHGAGGFRDYVPSIISFLLLSIALCFDYLLANKIEVLFYGVDFTPIFFKDNIRLFAYILAYLPVAFPVFKEMLTEIKKLDFFNEFSLMIVATVGAFYIGEYPEAVAVMLFYSVGELFQSTAVNKAKGSIKALLDLRPKRATVLRKNIFSTVSVEDVSVGETIQVKAGEKVPLDCIMLSEASSFDTSALTGESTPRSVRKGEKVLAGVLNLEKVVELKVEKVYSDSSFARILEMVQEATSKKAKHELFIRKFAKIYTPCVFLLAVLVVVVPYFWESNYVFNDWLYRALVMLVASCPCALVISIPLGYFGGIGAASRNGILFKGANYFDILLKVDTIALDKTGTLTKGIFEVQKVHTTDKIDEKRFLQIVKAVESQSNHPIAKAIGEYTDKIDIKDCKIENVEELAGYGLKATINDQEVLVGNTKLLCLHQIDYDRKIDSFVETSVVVAINKLFVGYISISDELKEDAKATIDSLHQMGIKDVIILSGDKDSITRKTAKILGVDVVYGDLLPSMKLKYIEKIKSDKSKVVAFVGDGINDSPVLALSDVGIAMGGMGSDAAIEIADIVIQSDQPSKIITAIKISKETKKIVIQNIVLAFFVKALVLLLAGFDMASMWHAVFADVGVALLAILNAVRILKKKF